MKERNVDFVRNSLFKIALEEKHQLSNSNPLNNGSDVDISLNTNMSSVFLYIP